VLHIWSESLVLYSVVQPLREQGLGTSRAKPAQRARSSRIGEE
jgi:hypothetical protein